MIVKNNLTLLALLLTSYFHGQSDTKLSLETMFNPFGEAVNYTPNLKLRYFFNDNLAFSSNINYTFLNTTEEILEVADDGVGTIEEKNSFTTLSLGIEKHFKNDKLSPYLGGSFILGIGSDNVYGSRTDGSVFANDFNYSSEQSINAFGFKAVTGVDIYLYEGLYLGTELGLQFLNTNYKRGEFKTTDASSTTNSETNTPIARKNITSFSLVNLGIVRFGWRF